MENKEHLVAGLVEMNEQLRRQVDKHHKTIDKAILELREGKVEEAINLLYNSTRFLYRVKVNVMYTAAVDIDLDVYADNWADASSIVNNDKWDEIKAKVRELTGDPYADVTSIQERDVYPIGSVGQVAEQLTFEGVQ